MIQRSNVSILSTGFGELPKGDDDRVVVVHFFDSQADLDGSRTAQRAFVFAGVRKDAFLLAVPTTKRGHP
jgi:hypothetical protein